MYTRISGSKSLNAYHALRRPRALLPQLPSRPWAAERGLGLWSNDVECGTCARAILHNAMKTVPGARRPLNLESILFNPGRPVLPKAMRNDTEEPKCPTTHPDEAPRSPGDCGASRAAKAFLVARTCHYMPPDFSMQEAASLSPLISFSLLCLRSCISTFIHCLACRTLGRKRLIWLRFGDTLILSRA